MRIRVSWPIVATLLAVACGRAPQSSQPATTSTVATNTTPATTRVTSTQRLVQQAANASYPLVSKPTVYVIGETHLGSSQIQVAKVMAAAFDERELDAVFLEQPDELTFDWAPYQSLQSDRERAIAALQQRLLEDAARPTEFRFGKFQSAVDAYLKHNDGARLQSEIEDRFGANAMDEFDRLTSQQEGLIEGTMKIYNNSEYISAADYMFVMLRLRGINTPFWNIESKTRRDAFKVPETADAAVVKKALRTRDEYMTDKLDALSRQHGYKQMLLICGALHLPGLPERLRAKGYTVTVLYDSLKGQAIKKEMATLVKPNIVIDIARVGPKPGFTPSAEYLVRNRPSRQLLSKVEHFLPRSIPGTSLSSAERKDFVARFEDAYEHANARSYLSWQLDVSVANGRIIRTTRTSDATVQVAALEPVRMTAAAVPLTTIPTAPLTLTVADFGTHFQVSDTLANKELYSGLSIPRIAELADERLASDPTRTIYLDVSDLDPKRASAFVESMRMQIGKSDRHVSLRGFTRTGTQRAQDLFFEGGTKIELRATPPEPISEGPHAGWYSFACDIVSAAGRLTVHFIAKTAEIANVAMLTIRELTGQPRFAGVSAAALLTEIRWELQRRHHFQDEDLLLQLSDEFGNSQFVSLHNTLERAA